MSGLERLEKLRAAVVAQLNQLGIPASPGYVHSAEVLPEKDGRVFLYPADLQAQTLLAALIQLDEIFAEKTAAANADSIVRGYDLAALLIQAGIGSLGAAARASLAQVAAGARAGREGQRERRERTGKASDGKVIEAIKQVRDRNRRATLGEIRAMVLRDVPGATPGQIKKLTVQTGQRGRPRKNKGR